MVSVFFPFNPIDNTWGFISLCIILLLCRISIVSIIANVNSHALFIEKTFLCEVNNCSRDNLVEDNMRKLYSDSYPNFISSGRINNLWFNNNSVSFSV